MKSEICMDSNTTTMFKAQDSSKDIVKIVHVKSVVQPYFMKLQEYFVWKVKNNFIQQFLLFHVNFHHIFMRVQQCLHRYFCFLHAQKVF